MEAEGDGRARVRNAQDLLVHLEERNEGTRAKILSRLSEPLRETIETAPRTSWIPIEDDARFVDALIEYFGPAGAESMWCEYSARFVSTPLQRALFDGAARIFGLTVGGLVRIIPRVWSTAYRDAGTVELQDADENSKLLVIRDMHPEMCSRTGYLILLRGLFRGMYKLAGDESQNFRVNFMRSERLLEAEFRWS